MESEDDGFDIFGEDQVDDDHTSVSSACANDGHVPFTHHLPFIGTSSYDNHSWDMDDMNLEVVFLFSEAKLEIFDLEDTMQSIASVNIYHLQALKGWGIVDLILRYNLVY